MFWHIFFVIMLTIWKETQKANQTVITTKLVFVGYRLFVFESYLMLFSCLCKYNVTKWPTRIQTHNNLIRKRTLNHLEKLAKWPVWLNDKVFADELSSFGFESGWCHLNFRFRSCSEQGFPWHSTNYRV